MMLPGHTRPPDPSPRDLTAWVLVDGTWQPDEPSPAQLMALAASLDVLSPSLAAGVRAVALGGES